jgi:hypothetical protein
MGDGVQMQILDEENLKQSSEGACGSKDPVKEKYTQKAEKHHESK